MKGIKDEYEAGEEVEVKMIYSDDIVTYVHLNGENIGWLNGTNSVKFNMPAKDSELVITYSNLEKNTFSNLFGYTIASATQIIIDVGPGSIVPPWMHYVYEVVDNDKIDLFLEYLNNTEFIETEAMVGVGTKTLTIKSNDAEFKINFTNRNDLWINGKLYKSTLAFPELNSRLIYQYYEDFMGGTFSSFGKESQLSTNYFNDIKFLPFSPKANLTYATKFGTITIDGLSMMLISKDAFMDSYGNTYTIVGDKDFSDLLEGVNIETSVVRVNSYTIIVSKNTEYTLSELKKAIHIFEFEPFTLVKEDGSEFESLLITEDITLQFQR